MRNGNLSEQPVEYEEPRVKFERLMAEGRVDEAERYLQALAMFVKLDEESRV